MHVILRLLATRYRKCNGLLPIFKQPRAGHVRICLGTMEAETRYKKCNGLLPIFKQPRAGHVRICLGTIY